VTGAVQPRKLPPEPLRRSVLLATPVRRTLPISGSDRYRAHCRHTSLLYPIF